jgi:catechol 2,3-dioxygenase-like lactoylglutathione lyase family enzyme
VAGVAEIGSSLRTSSATVELGRRFSCREAIPMEFIIYPELPAKDINRAAAWYRERLGLEPVLHGNEPIEPGTTEFEYDLLYDTGTAKFGVYESFAAGRSEATAARIVVTDFDAAHAELVSNGVVFEDYDFGDDFRTVDGVLVSEDGEKTAWFKDSEGNILAIGSSY